MQIPSDAGSQHEARWREILTRGPGGLLTRGPLGYRAARWVLRRVPSRSRCKNCYRPFDGMIGRVVGVFGFGPSRKNPSMCDF